MGMPMGLPSGIPRGCLWDYPVALIFPKQALPDGVLVVIPSSQDGQKLVPGRHRGPGARRRGGGQGNPGIHRNSGKPGSLTGLLPRDHLNFVKILIFMKFIYGKPSNLHLMFFI